MAGKEFIVDGAMCMCKYGATPGKIMVTNNKFFKINGNKLSATTLTLGNAIYPPGFGTCKINPIFPKPCVPAISKWSEQFDKIGIMGGFPLTDKSKGTCSCGCPDCIEFMQTGQIPVPGTKQMQKATAEHQGELDAMGNPTALTEHPVNTQITLQPIQGDVLVEKVKGESESFLGQTLTYEVEHYNTETISNKTRSLVQWKITIDNQEESITQPGKDILKLLIKKEWQGKELCVMAYINAPSKNVSVNTQIKKWIFPIVIDRYKMPGLNEDGSDIADDMAYGYGHKYKRPIYTDEETQLYKSDYAKEGFDESKHAIFSNKDNWEQPKDENNDHTTSNISPDYSIIVQDKIKAIKPEIPTVYKVKITRGKSIYEKNDIPQLVDNIKKYIRGSIYGPIEVIKTISDLFKDSDDINNALFAEFRNMAANIFSFADAEMKQNINAMIDKFKRNEGGVYENSILTNKIQKHPSTLRYCKEVESYLCKMLNKHNGDVSKLKDLTIYWKKYNEKKEDITKERRDQTCGKGYSLTPVFDSGFCSFKKWAKKPEQMKNATQGYTIALNDIWAAEILITQYELQNNKNFELEYQITLWDHFGLNVEDIEWNKFVGGYLEGFHAWFILQHFKGFKPFITKITFKNKLKGTINEK